MDSITAWDNEDEKLIAEMTSFETNWKHKKPCNEYAKSGYCVHLERAQGRKFKNRVRTHIATLASHFKLDSEPNKSLK